MGSAEQRKVTELDAYRKPGLSGILLEQVDILAEREGGLYDCYVPLGLVDHEEVPIKQDHAEEIANDMRLHKEKYGGTGQHAPVQFGLVEGEGLLKIVDGFHRDAAVRINGEPTVYATIQNMDWDELYDQRIFTAKDHSQVRFSRVVQWMVEIWGKSDLSQLVTEKGENLTLRQATTLYSQGSTGVKLGLSPYDSNKVKDWIKAKEERWGIKANTFHQYLAIAENVDPELVHSARERGGGTQKLEGPTQTILKEFSKHIPGRFDLQRYIMQRAIENNSPSKAVQALAAELRDVIDNTNSKGEATLAAVGHIECYQWHDDSKRGAGASKPKTTQLRQASDPRSQGRHTFKNALDIVEKARLRTAIAREEKEGVSQSERQLVREAIGRAKEIEKELGLFVVEASRLIGIKPEESSAAQHPANTIATEASYDDSDVQPKERKTRNMRVELNHFGIVSNEDWAAFPDHYKLALSIFSPELWDKRHASSKHALIKAFKEAGLNKDDRSLSAEDIHEAGLNMIKTLGVERGGQGPYVKWDDKKARLFVESNSIRHLTEVFRETLVNVDESKT